MKMAIVTVLVVSALVALCWYAFVPLACMMVMWLAELLLFAMAFLSAKIVVWAVYEVRMAILRASMGQPVPRAVARFR